MSDNAFIIPINNRYILNIVYKWRCLLFNDTSINIYTLVERAIKTFVDKLNKPIPSGLKIGFASFDEVIYYKIPNDPFSLINFEKKYYDLYELDIFKNDPRI